VVVALNIDDASGIDAFGLDLSYDTSTLIFVKASTTTLTSHFAQFGVNEIASGTVRIGGYDPTPIASGGGSLVDVWFRIREGASSESQIRLFNLVDSLSSASTAPGAFNILPVVTVTRPEDGTIYENLTQTTVTGSVTGTSVDYGTVSCNGTETVISISEGSFNVVVNLSYGKNTIIVSIPDEAENIGSAAIVVMVVAEKEIVAPGERSEIALPDKTKIELIENILNATITITINDRPRPEDYSGAILPEGASIEGVEDCVREFGCFLENDARRGTTTGRFRITIPYPAQIPDDEAENLRILYLNTDTNRWELVGGEVDTINHTVTVEVTHLSIFRLGILIPFAKNLQNVVVYPNPYIASKHDKVYFKEITQDSVIKIFTLAGELVKEIRVSKTPEEWDVKNQAGSPVASGVYIYLITDTVGNKAMGKIGVIR
jgi:hypothetical protein